jgi:DNA-binding transcriptional regulator YiaG
VNFIKKKEKILEQVGQFKLNRLQLGYNLSGLAAAISINVAMVHRWEAGTSKITAQYYKKLKAIGFPDSALLNPSKEITID